MKIAKLKIDVESAGIKNTRKELTRLASVIKNLKALGVKVDVDIDLKQFIPVQISEQSDEQLLRELIRRNPVSQGPSKSVHAGTIREANICIGNDNMATILLHQDDVEALEERNS